MYNDHAIQIYIHFSVKLEYVKLHRHSISPTTHVLRLGQKCQYANVDVYVKCEGEYLRQSNFLSPCETNNSTRRDVGLL